MRHLKSLGEVLTALSALQRTTTGASLLSLRSGEHNLAMLARFRIFASMYPRYRDLGYLKHQLIGWDAAINRLFNHKHGKVPANNLARRHPFVLSTRIAPRTWSRDAVQGCLPHYDWEAVLEDMKQDTSAHVATPASANASDAAVKDHALEEAQRSSLASWDF
ncbi:hypothetical protein WJX73_001552 [Symbiochloris irregularis]|uniref:Uncharacterized protein n=1 Tax=Symbiochloris irregularis TaxID=706552 RepID=A0AAW1NYS1_9CHLO